ncbi:hypothetical protein HMN09_00510600 [Mycena chlorophos]|uniref:DUF1742-domain-containing protein n=1 Tax=Mycena chlorophos TaxID=658473 RepID=A0A8H6WEE9_MYCCL|nr:hypothetical protein HMN09_00510600 [Mycena chlorophos]
MSFTNLYYKRTAGTNRPCFICYRPTTTVLATVNTVDFIYTCDTHLKDPGFATLSVPAAAASPAVSQEDVGKVIAEYEEKQRRKKEKEKEKEDEKKKKDEDKDKKEDKKEDTKKKDESKPTSPAPSPKPAAPAGSHEKYILHRDIFAMRLAEHRRKRQAAQAKDLAPRFPGAPSGTLQ